MKNYILLFAIASTCLFPGCGGSGTTTTSTNDSIPDESLATCIWDNIFLKETPDESGKWISSISIGESVKYMDEYKEVNTDKKPITYYKVKLKDNKEGWAQSDFVILKSKPAAIVEVAELYSRPDLLTKTGKVFSKMDIIAVKSEQNGFIEVAGKRKGGKWIETGWIKPNSVTYTDVDIAVAKFACKALEISDAQKRKAAIDEVVSNSDLKSSIFISSLSEPETTEKVSDTTKTE